MSEVRVIDPIAVGDSWGGFPDAPMLDTNVSETTGPYAVPLYDAATTYGLGLRCTGVTLYIDPGMGGPMTYVSNHKIYESLQAANTGNDPATSPAWWIVVGPTNQWAPFDQSISTATLIDSGTIGTAYWKFNVSKRVSAVAFIGLKNARSYRVQLSTSGGAVAFNRARLITPLPAASTWYAWCFGARKETTQVIVDDLPLSAPGAALEVWVEAITGVGEIGQIVFGELSKIGTGAEYGARIGTIDFSVKSTTAFGDTTIKVQKKARKASVTTAVPAGEVDRTEALLETLQSKATVWLLSNQYDRLTIYGFLKSYDTTIAYTTSSTRQLEIEGLT
jgi:hypothetical protein